MESHPLGTSAFQSLLFHVQHNYLYINMLHWELNRPSESDSGRWGKLRHRSLQQRSVLVCITAWGEIGFLARATPCLSFPHVVFQLEVGNHQLLCCLRSQTIYFKTVTRPKSRRRQDLTLCKCMPNSSRINPICFTFWSLMRQKSHGNCHMWRQSLLVCI